MATELKPCPFCGSENIYKITKLDSVKIWCEHCCANIMRGLLTENMTVSICHSKSCKEDIYSLTSNADAVIVAVGKPKALGFGFLRDDCVVIDCGINRDENGKLCGDVDYCNSERRTPVPGGVGLMTRAMLMKHVERR